jgi:hypothetical protein
MIVYNKIESSQSAPVKHALAQWNSFIFHGHIFHRAGCIPCPALAGQKGAALIGGEK